jgi:hypothetical protein
VVIVRPMALTIRQSKQVVRAKVGNKNLKTIRIHNGIRKKTDKVHALDLLIVRVHVSLMRALRRLMQTQFLVLLPPMPTIRRLRAMRLGHVRRHAIKNLCGVI